MEIRTEMSALTDISDSDDCQQDINNKKRKKNTMMDYFKKQTLESASQSNKRSDLNTKQTVINVKEKTKKSPLWRFFSKIETSLEENEKAQCNLCSCVLSLGGRGRRANTSNLKSHLQKYHKEENDRIEKGKEYILIISCYRSKK